MTKDSADHTGSFGKVKITKEGTYQWTVSETNKGKTIDGLAHDREDKTVTIKVKKGQNGKLVAEEGSSLVQTAEFTNRRAITVRWLDGDGKTELDTATYLAGEDQPPFSGNTPTKEADQDYVYTFSGWDQGSENGDTITYKPLFDKKGRTYGAPNWEWTGNDQEGYSAAKASFTTNDGEKEFTLSEKDEQVAVDRTEASCIEDGKVVYTATVTFRGEDYKDEKIIILKGTGHDWGDWVIVKQPTSTKEGEKQRTCKHDPSHVEKETIPAIGGKKTSGTLLLKLTAYVRPCK